jgi:hypothetical protein
MEQLAQLILAFSTLISTLNDENAKSGDFPVFDPT